MQIPKILLSIKEAVVESEQHESYQFLYSSQERLVLAVLLASQLLHQLLQSLYRLALVLFKTIKSNYKIKVKSGQRLIYANANNCAHMMKKCYEYSYYTRFT